MKRRIVLSFLALILGFSLGLLAFGGSPVLAALCPQCFGFSKVSPNLYIEARASGRGPELLNRIQSAKQKIAPAFEGLPAAAQPKAPRIVACVTPTCDSFMGGANTLAEAYGAQFIYLGPSGLDRSIIAHELVHTTLSQVLGWRQKHSFPAWVDEGLAVYISDDPRFDLDPATCQVSIDPWPEKARDWRHITGQNGAAQSAAYYGSAGCAVSKWFATHPEKDLHDLLTLHMTP
ncbi:hypothetical protein EDD53_0254 [Pacificibacter maritimus]|uniref:DUF4157 domain-containing protein n=1 Tax=Pacificibacter maritimus TaxID=762213 RepID=A0A3N4UU99_9RHOB|nr:hypothetical protein [Pacificibacter maritimus]RPE71141.1 hypothetical protein EDD53_0254 [Pacificibacter maritimus]